METTSNTAKCILVPTDFSEVCDNALNHAIELGKYLNLKIYVLHVVDITSTNYFISELADPSGIIESNKEYIEIIFEKLHSYTKSKENDSIIPIIKEGELFSSIEEATQELNAELIILGTHGKIGFQKLFGSYALKVIDSCKSPIIIVQKRLFNHGYKNIIFPVSIDDEDRQKTDYVIKLASIFKSHIHVFPKLTDRAKSNNKLKIIISQITTHFEKFGIPYSIADSHEYGDTWERQLMNYSASIEADLIVILSNPEKHSIFFTPKEEGIIFNTAQIPVMCINYKKTKIVSFFGGYSSDHPNIY